MRDTGNVRFSFYREVVERHLSRRSLKQERRYAGLRLLVAFADEKSSLFTTPKNLTFCFRRNLSSDTSRLYDE